MNKQGSKVESHSFLIKKKEKKDVRGKKHVITNPMQWESSMWFSFKLDQLVSLCSLPTECNSHMFDLNCSSSCMIHAG